MHVAAVARDRRDLISVIAADAHQRGMRLAAIESAHTADEMGDDELPPDVLDEWVRAARKLGVVWDSTVYRY